MEQRTITHETGGRTLTVTVSEATTLMGMKHSMLISQAISYMDGQRQKLEAGQTLADVLAPDELDLYMLRRYAWPDCRASAISAEGFDLPSLTFEEFCEMPEAFVAPWQKAARELNGHWYEEEEEQTEEEKKGDSAPASK